MPPDEATIRGRKEINLLPKNKLVDIILILLVLASLPILAALELNAFWGAFAIGVIKAASRL
jgi:hypothetical protein